ncbi:hypothetical protein BKI52_44665 [marine bacterium AO1-C]|nr:hypothetical protein BKI52_44665 [marine bacterium AO1-C]
MVLVLISLFSCEESTVSVLKPVREFRILKSLEQQNQWWYRERKWYMSSFQKQGNDPKTFARLEKVMNHTNRYIQFIDRLKSDLIKYIGKGVDPNTKMPKDPEAKPQVKRFFEYFNKEFSTRFALYEQQMRAVTTPIQQANLRDILKGQEDQSYLATYFSNTTVVEALQVLTLLQIKVFENEHTIWEKSNFKHRDFVPNF